MVAVLTLVPVACNSVFCMEVHKRAV